MPDLDLDLGFMWSLTFWIKDSIAIEASLYSHRKKVLLKSGRLSKTLKVTSWWSSVCDGLSDDFSFMFSGSIMPSTTDTIRIEDVLQWQNKNTCGSRAYLRSSAAFLAHRMCICTGRPCNRSRAPLINFERNVCKVWQPKVLTRDGVAEHLLSFLKNLIMTLLVSWGHLTKCQYT